MKQEKSDISSFLVIVSILFLVALLYIAILNNKIIFQNNKIDSIKKEICEVRYITNPNCTYWKDSSYCQFNPNWGEIYSDCINQLKECGYENYKYKECISEDTK